jgi:hypothetical protein
MSKGDRPTYYLIQQKSQSKGKTSLGEDLLGAIGIGIIMIISLVILILIPASNWMGHLGNTIHITAAIGIVVILGVIMFLKELGS